MNSKNYDVVIVGGAAAGSAAAYFLGANNDFQGKVLVIEQDPSYSKCATALSAASIRHQFSTPENILMSQFGTQFLRSFSEDLAINNNKPDASFVEGGYLFLASEDGLQTLKENHEIQKSLNADVALLTPKQLSQRYPWMNTEDISAASLGLSGEGWLDAYGMMQGMRKKAISLGAEYIQAKVSSIITNDSVTTGVKLDDGTVINAKSVINTAGTGAKSLAATAGIKLPIESKKRCVFYVESPATITNCPMVIDHTGAYFRPEGKGFITGISPDESNDPESYDFDVQHELFEEVIWPILATRVPEFEALRCTHSWAGHYDMNLIDQNVIIGAHPSLENLLFANGFSGHGMQQAPAVGKALSELIIYNEYKTLDLTRMGWERIINNHPIKEKNVV